MVRRFFRGLAQGQAEMKKISSKRGSGVESGLGSAVLDAPGESYASETEARGTRRGPAPAGALQRGFGSAEYGGDAYEESGTGSVYGGLEEPEYVPRRGRLRFRLGGLPRSVAGRIVLGVVVFGVLGAVVLSIAGVRYYLMHDPRFVLASSDDIQIQGAEHLTRRQVLSVFGADLERNIFRVSLGERQADLERLPWVAHADVMRLLPDTIRVRITERTPVAFVRQGTQIGLVDGSGVLLDMPPDAAGDPHYSFPVLTGLSAEETAQARGARMEVYGQFMREMEGAGQHLTDSVSEVDVSDPEDVKALITEGSSDILVHFGQEDFLRRYREFDQHLPEWRQAYPKLASADMRYEGQIVLEMQNGVGGATGGVTEAAGVAAPAAMPTATAAGAAKATTAKAKATAGILRSAQDDGVRGRAAVAATGTSPTKPAVVTRLTTAVKPAATAKPVAGVKPGAVTKFAAAGKPAVAKVMAAKVVVRKVSAKPVVKKAGVKPSVVAKAKGRSGADAANQKLFAELAAAHRAELAKANKTDTGKLAKSGGTSGKSGVSP